MYPAKVVKLYVVLPYFIHTYQYVCIAQMGNTIYIGWYSVHFCRKKLTMKQILILFLSMTLIGSVQAQKAGKSKSNKKAMVKEENQYVHFHGAPALHVFQEAGYEVELVSTEGGKLEIDGYSNPTDASGYSAHDVITLGYMQKPDFNQMLANTKKLTEVNPNDYAAIFLVGGQGPMYTFRGNKELEKLFVQFYESQKHSAAVCHSATLLLEAKKTNGELLVKGKTWTGFADAEEEFADKAVGRKIQPYRIETEARKLANTQFKVSAPFSSYAIQDGNLITGQQQNSGAAAARMVVEMLEKKSK